MFFTSSKNRTGLGKVETLISHDTKVDGIIEASGTIRVDGTINGGIKKADGVIIGDTGIIEGNIKARAVSLAGKVKGNIHSETNLELLPGSALVGDIETSKLSIAEGAHFDGVCHMLDEAGEHRERKKGIRSEREEQIPQEPT